MGNTWSKLWGGERQGEQQEEEQLNDKVDEPSANEEQNQVEEAEDTVVPKKKQKMEGPVASGQSNEEDEGKSSRKEPETLSSDEDEEDAVTPFPRKLQPGAKPVIVLPQRKANRPPARPAMIPIPRKPLVSTQAAAILRGVDPNITAQFLKSGKLSAEVLAIGSEEYSNILDYIRNGQVHGFGIRLEAALKVERKLETETPAVPSPASTLKVMLWHGTLADRVGPILNQGFLIPAPGTQMFGQGIYFADRITKSALYCTSAGPIPDTIGYVFLSEVELGTIYKAKNPNCNYRAPPSILRSDGQVVPCHSVMSVGEHIPSRATKKKIDGVIWPLGPTVRNSEQGTYATLFNEFIVYNPSQIQIKYLAKVRFLPAPYFGE